jgi:aryl-phospho-beta-D-glucosidase BglC (GH1 family)
MRFVKEALVVVAILFSLSLISFPRAYTGNPLSFPASGIISSPNTYLKPYVDGTVIMDPSGNPIRLQGFNVEPEDIDEEVLQWLKSRGFNSLRVTFYWSSFEGQEGRYDYSYLNSLDNLLELCEEYNIYAIIDFHQWQWSSYFTYYQGDGIGFPEWLIREGDYADSSSGLGKCIGDFFLSREYGVTMRQKFFEIWEFLVNRYKNNSYVWAYEVINEPTIAKNAYLSLEVRVAVMDLYEEFTETIRKIDNETIIIYHHIGPDAERKVEYDNIVWTRSWYDVAYGGYNPTSEYGDLLRRLQDLKDQYNIVLETPFVVSEIGFTEGTSGAEQWIRDTFDVMRSIGLNEGFECWSWWIYSKGTKYGYQTPRDRYGSDTWIVPVLQEYV